MNEQDYISMELREDEWVLWRGQPELSGKGVLPKGYRATAIFGLFPLAFGIVWIYTAAQSAGFAFALFGLPILAFSFYMIFGQINRRKKILSTTQYAITDKRIIIASGGKVKTMALEDIPCIEKQYFPDGNGTVSFDPPEQTYTAYYGQRVRTSPTIEYVPYAFENIRDCNEAARIVEDARAAVKSRS